MRRMVNLQQFIGARSVMLRAYDRFRVAGGPVESITANVSCRTCSACCRSYDVPLEPHESAAGLDVVERDGVRYLRRDEAGVCVHLSAMGCSVHSKRPGACRVYDCREFAVVNVRIPNKPLVTQAIEQWDARPLGQREQAAVNALTRRAQANAAAGAQVTEAVRCAYMEG